MWCLYIFGLQVTGSGVLHEREDMKSCKTIGIRCMLHIAMFSTIGVNSNSRHPSHPPANG